MPRKLGYQIDYEDYEDYENYEDYYDNYDLERNAPETSNTPTKPGIWRCSICTYDNDDGLLACDICGVIRCPVPNVGSNNDKRTVDGMCRDCEASVMAKSLFASLPRQMPTKSVIFQQKNAAFVVEEGNKLHKFGTIQRNFHDIPKAFSSHDHHYHIDIAPFKFDVPSPDDVVSTGMRSSKMNSKVNLSPDISASVIARNATHETPEKSGRSLLSNGQDGGMDDDTSSLGKAIKPVASSSSHGKLTSIDNNLDETHDSSVNVGRSENLTSSFSSMPLKTDRSMNASAGKATKPAYKPEKWMLPVQSEDNLTQLNLAIVGHVDSGKSTLSGRLLHLMGQISKKEIHKYEKEARLQGKGSFAYAWALDESAEERERGITMTVAVAYFDTKKYHVVLLDSPGHKDFVPNMISGATQADAAILVIDASRGSFEVGMDSTGGQTREHAQLIRSFGVDQIIVAINKMDAVHYSKERFDFIKGQLRLFLRSCGFKDAAVSWIPLSASENQNLVTSASDVRLLSWYQGPCLLDAIDSLQPPVRDFSKPLVMPICDVIRSRSLGQVSACGKLEAGALRSGVKVLVMPSGDLGTVRSLERDSQPCSIARAGDNVAVTLQGVEITSVMAGGVLCHPDFPVAIANHLELKILILEVAAPILIGSQLEFHIHHAKEAARVVKIVSLLDAKTGKVTKKAPRCLLAKQSAVVEVMLHGAVCVEAFSNCRALGRVFLRASGKTVAVGIVNRLVEQ